MKSRRTMDLIGVNVFESGDLIATGGRSNHQWGKPMGAIARWTEAFAEPDAVVRLRRYPVPVLFVVSVKAKRFEDPVAAL